MILVYNIFCLRKYLMALLFSDKNNVCPLYFLQEKIFPPFIAPKESPYPLFFPSQKGLFPIPMIPARVHYKFWSILCLVCIHPLFAQALFCALFSLLYHYNYNDSVSSSSRGSDSVGRRTSKINGPGREMPKINTPGRRRRRVCI